MVKRIALVLVATIAFSLGSLPQKRIKTTQKLVELEEGRKGEVILASLSNDNFIYMVTMVGRGRKAQTAISKYDKRMNLLKKTEWDLDYKEGSFTSLQELKDGLVVLFENTDRKAKTTEVYARFMDGNTLSLRKKRTLYEKEFESRRDMYGMNVQIENDYVLLYQTLEGRSKDQLKANFRVLNSDLEKQWEKDIVFPFINKKSDFLDIELSNKGNVYFVVSNRNDETKEWDKYLYAVTSEGGSVLKDNLGDLPEELTDINLQATEEGDIIVAGYYGEQVERAYRKGTFYGEYSGETLRVRKVTSGLLPISLLMENKSKKVKRKTVRKSNKGKNTGLDNYFVVDRIITKEDGGAIIVGEHFHHYVTTTTTTDANGRTTTTTTHHYEYDDILVVSISAGGELEWERIIPKRQHTTNSAITSSYTMVINEDKMYFIFNDDRENHSVENEATNNFITKRKDMVISVYELSSAGYVQKDILTDFNEIEGTFMPRYSEQIGDNEVMLYVIGRKRSKKALFVTFD